MTKVLQLIVLCERNVLVNVTVTYRDIAELYHNVERGKIFLVWLRNKHKATSKHASANCSV